MTATTQELPLIRWTFFFNEGNVKSEVNKEEEDKRIASFIDENPKGILMLPGDPTDIYINLPQVKAIVRQIVDVEAEKMMAEAQAAQAAAQAQNSAPQAGQ